MPKELEAVLPLETAIRIPIRQGGWLDLGPGDVPYTLRVSSVWRVDEPTDESDRISLAFGVVVSDGTYFLLQRTVDLGRLFCLLETAGEPDNRVGERVAERLAIRIDQRRHMTLPTNRAGSTVPVQYRLKYLSLRCDVLLVRRQTGDGGGDADRLAIRLYSELSHDPNGGPTPGGQYSFRSLAKLFEPPLFHGLEQGQDHFEFVRMWPPRSALHNLARIVSE